jgi:peptidase E
MTKYILNSGGLRNNSEKAKKFFAEVVKGLGDNPRLLICYFAQKREDWEEKFSEDKETILTSFPEEIHLVVNLAFPSTFEQQIKDSDVIYITGGDDHLLQYWLKQFNLPMIWEGKIVATNSSGSNALAKYSWTCDWRQNIDGLGILPIKFIPHYKSSFGSEDPRGPIDWDKAFSELKNYKEDLPIYALEEGEFKVFD